MSLARLRWHIAFRALPTFRDTIAVVKGVAVTRRLVMEVTGAMEVTDAVSHTVTRAAYSKALRLR